MKGSLALAAVMAASGAKADWLTRGKDPATLKALELMKEGWVPSLAQQRVMAHLSECHTAAYGGHVERCDRCAYEKPSYNSCRDRHCPSCQGHRAREWLEARESELLPVPYFHTVFTMPGELSELALVNKKVIYAMLFAASAETLKEVASRRLGAEIGFLSVLHTWTQTMIQHVHNHMVVPGGGLSRDGQRWIRSRQTFLLPVRVLSRVYRGKFLAKLKHAYDQGLLNFSGKWARLAKPTAFAGWLGALREKRWVVYAKRPFGSPAQVLAYLSRYTHKVAISDSRLVRFEDEQVTFRYRDRKMGNIQREMTLDVREFARRFLQHVLPKAMPRVRSYGFLANTCRATKLELCRKLLGVASASSGEESASEQAEVIALRNQEADDQRCPMCGVGTLHRKTRPNCG